MMSRFTADAAVWRDIASRARMRLCVSVFLETINQGVSFDPASLRWLADRTIALDFDIYAADDTEPEPALLERMPGQGSTH